MSGDEKRNGPRDAPSGVAVAADRPKDAPPEHPFDRWLTRELDALYAGYRSEPLPDEIADLASELEARLQHRARRGRRRGTSSAG